MSADDPEVRPDVAAVRPIAPSVIIISTILFTANTLWSPNSVVIPGVPCTGKQAASSDIFPVD